MGGVANYTQVKVSIDSEIASAFKTTCLASNVSMASVISEYMAKYSGYGGNSVNKTLLPDLSTRRQRRTAVRTVLQQLEQLKDAEERYRDNIPENLQGSMVFERADNFISLLEETSDLLESIE